MRLIARVRACDTGLFLKRFHGWATVAWAILLVPSLLWWRESVPWLVTISVWANLVGHFSSWQASRVEVQVTDTSS